VQNVTVMPRINSDEAFVCEPITPVAGTFDARAMARGEPGLPQAFTWRQEEYAVARVVESWRSTGKDRGGGSEVYVRRHWYRIETTGGEVMTLYFDRQPLRGRGASKGRWTRYSMVRQEERE